VTGHCEEEMNVTCAEAIFDPCKRRGDGIYANFSTNCQDYYKYEYLK
jgi:hypothetical protein